MNLRTSAENKVFEIADTLEEQPMSSFALLTGEAGRILFLLNLYQYSQEEKYYEKSLVLLDHLLDKVFAKGGYYTYCNGLAGFGWFITHLQEQEHADTDDLESTLSGLDQYLFRFFKEDLEKQNFDFLHGASGLLYYYLHRGHQEAIDLYIDALLKSGQRDEDSALKWPFFIGELEMSHYNFGLAHGIPSQISLLSRLLPHTDQKEVVSGMIRDAVKYILKHHQTPEDFKSYFPHNIKDGEPYANSRLAWCYGDPGVSCGLWSASEALQDDSLKQFVTQVLEHNAIRKTTEDSSIIEAGFCHGSAGIAQIYQTFSTLTNSATIKQTSEYWYNATLDFAIHDNGVAGYKAYEGKSKGWVKDFGLLTGVSGIGLSLLSYLDPKLQNWSQALLLPGTN